MIYYIDKKNSDFWINNIFILTVFSILFFFPQFINAFEAYDDTFLSCNQCCCAPTYYADVSFLYWHASMNHLQYASTLETTIINPDLTPPKDVSSHGNIKGIDPDWDPGVRVAIGYTPCCSPFNFLIGATYFHSRSKAKNSVVPSFGSTNLSYQIPLWNSLFMGNVVQDASATWTLDFGYIDLLASGAFAPWKCLRLTPNFGLRAVWIENQYQADYDTVAFTTSLPPSVVIAPHSDSSFHTRYQAIGLKVGSDFEIPCFCNFSVIGEAGGSIFYGPIKSKTTIHGFNLEANSEPTAVLTSVEAIIENRVWQIRSNLEAQVGLGYKGCCRSFGYALSASYIFSIWFDQNDFYNFSFSPASTNDIVSGENLTSQNFANLERKYSNLQLQGLILKASVYF